MRRYRVKSLKIARYFINRVARARFCKFNGVITVNGVESRDERLAVRDLGLERICN